MRSIIRESVYRILKESHYPHEFEIEFKDDACSELSDELWNSIKYDNVPEVDFYAECDFTYGEERSWDSPGYDADVDIIDIHFDEDSPNNKKLPENVKEYLRNDYIREFWKHLESEAEDAFWKEEPWTAYERDY